MKKFYGENELRRMYLEFFESKGHLKMNSFSLVPHNDNSLLLINAGMAPLKPYFTGQEIPPRRRVTTCQKCIRIGDIENLCQKLPGPCDRFMLKIISEREVTKHLKECKMSCCLTNVLDITGTDTFLDKRSRSSGRENHKILPRSGNRRV